MLLALFIGIPLVAAVPVAWGWGLSWADAGIAVVMYLISGTASPSVVTGCSPTLVPCLSADGAGMC